MVNNQRVLYNNTNYILKGPLLWVTLWSRSLFITAKFIFGDLACCCECCHTVGSTRLDINYIKCYNSAQKQKVEYK